MNEAGTDPVAGDNVIEDDQRGLIASTFQRVITKCRNKGHSDKNHPWAVNVMGPVVQAYGRIHNVGPLESRSRLSDVMSDYVCEDVALEDEHAELFANRIIDAIGDNNHGA